ncbi:MAG TPA: glutamate synthase large subunit [Gaiellales bacterium]|jgi:glutamate synthase (ferredoxin)|nr:glutamate synthase large subunit [Gaiellales bacterium]
MSEGLHQARFEHDACGLGALVRLDGRPTHELVRLALVALANLDHRGATGADAETGDGAGITVQQPDRFLRSACRSELELELPPPGAYAAGLVFLPRDPGRRLRCEELCVRICAEEGHRALGWRDVPVRPDQVGRMAAGTAPVIRMLIVERRAGDEEAFERALYVIRRRVERAAMQAAIPEAEFTIVSLSARRLVYKGLLRATQLGAFYPELRDARFESGLALVHSRFSTNTLGTWDLAHPFNLLAHNGEINTIRGNASWLSAREPQLQSELLGRDLQKLFPVLEERWSDSAKLDAALELLMMAGRSLPHALAMLIPPAWTDPALDLPADVRAFHEFHASLVEPWDGPAAVIATDGRRVVATLDRNGLRPGRWLRTRDGLVVLASEIGVLPIDPEEIAEAGRLEPGRMLAIDPERGRVVDDAEIKRELAARRPYARWLADHKVFLDDLPPEPVAPILPAALRRMQAAFGQTAEEVELVLAPMARDGAEPVGSMGDDTPLAVLSERRRPLADHFKQQFAQVTNPAIDPQREGMVMSLRTSVGAIGNLLGERPDDCRRVAMRTPVLRDEELEKLRHLRAKGLSARTLSTLYAVDEGPAALERAVDGLCRAASQAVWDGVRIVILSDRAVRDGMAPIPALLATAAVHSHLAREGARTMCGLVVESGEPRETMHHALLIGYGAAAVNPYLALATVRQQQSLGLLGELTADEAEQNYVQAVGKGLLKVCSKMGISTIQSYRGAQIFEAVGLGPGLVERYFPGTVSRLGGIELDAAHETVAACHARAFTGPPPAAVDPGEYRFRQGGERHAWDPSTIVPLQRAVRDASPDSFAAFAEAADRAAAGTLRGLLGFRPAEAALPLEAVEGSAEIVRRFATGAMSLGSLSPEAHETLAIAMNRLGGRSNTGEGGEDDRRSVPDANGDLRRSAIRQVASGRFGVTAAYLVAADQLQIKIAQGAKPGEGGQLPGDKVAGEIARLRHATPGVGLISPPPHHDIYSIEDLAQLIHDLRCVNPAAEVSVKLVAEAGVGTIAAGVAKAGADHIVIAGHDGGTGASPLSSLKRAGLPWELGLAEAHQVLVANRLRDRVRLQVDGGLRTGRDVLAAALLGADEFAFSTAPLIAAGCVMMRVCHLNTCPVGIATQDPELRRRFAGTPEHVVRYMLFVAEQVREGLAELGACRLGDVVGRAELLRAVGGAHRGLDLAPLIHPAGGDPPRRRAAARLRPDARLIELAGPALERGQRVSAQLQVANTDRSLGAGLAGEIARRHGAAGLPDDTITLRLRGVGGQSLGAWAPRGLTLVLDGPCNDYAGKGLSGGTLVIRPPAAGSAEAHRAIAGNTLLYGATSGQAFVRGRAGERFAVRNSGADAVVEGVGDHGCEYMTGGVVVVLGETGRNFAAGMSGGVALVLDAERRLEARLNQDMVELCPLTDQDAARLEQLLVRHELLTGSPMAARLLADGPERRERFRLVLPHDVRRIREAAGDPAMAAAL